MRTVTEQLKAEARIYSIAQLWKMRCKNKVYINNLKNNIEVWIENICVYRTQDYPKQAIESLEFVHLAFCSILEKAEENGYTYMMVGSCDHPPSLTLIGMFDIRPILLPYEIN